MRSTARSETSRLHLLAPAQRVRISTEQSRLVRLGVVYADSLRLTILTELYMREMSPKEFYEKIGGSSLDSVRKHFLKLEEYGWLRRVRKRPNNRGRPSFVYRATELALIDEETWAEIPCSIRDAFTLQLMQQLSERLGLAFEAGTVEARDDHVFSLLSPITLDEAGWKTSLRLLMNCLRELEQEQMDAKVRLAKEGSRSMLMIVALAGFQSAGATPLGQSILPPSLLPLDTRIPWAIRLAKVFGDPLLLKIMWELNSAAMSPSELQVKVGSATTQTFDRKCKILTGLGWAIQVEGQGTPSGARRVFYRATSPAVSPSQAWEIISPAFRTGPTWETYQHLCELVFAAVQHGTFNSRTDRHLTWNTLLLDEAGWERVTQMLSRLVKSLTALKRRETRHISAKKTPPAFTYFIGGFESPPLDELPLWGDFGRLA